MFVFYDFTHLWKRSDCDACQAKIRMFSVRRENPHLTFQVRNQKLSGSQLHTAHEWYKTATTVEEACALGVSKPMIRYDIG